MIDFADIRPLEISYHAAKIAIGKYNISRYERPIIIQEMINMKMLKRKNQHCLLIIKRGRLKSLENTSRMFHEVGLY